jgi:hypothetical protein
MSTPVVLRHDLVSRGNELAARLPALSITTIQALHVAGITTIDQFLRTNEALLRQHPFTFGEAEIDAIYSSLALAGIEPLGGEAP